MLLTFTCDDDVDSRHLSDPVKLELVPIPVADVDRAKAFKYASFSDPDGNTLTLQEMSWRTGDAY